MSVSDGEKADAANFNSSFISREVDSSTVGKLDLENTDGASGDSVTNVQRELNGQDSFVTDSTQLNGAENRKPTWTSDSIGTPNQAVKERVDSVQNVVESNQTVIAENQSDIADIRTTTGTADGDTDMGTYSGSTISDNVDQATVNQELETAVESKIDTSEKAAANGVATLDGTGKIPSSQLTVEVMEYLGSYDASVRGSGSPSLTDGSGDTGDYYRVGAAGSVDHGAGSVTYAIGDVVMYSGAVWEKYQTSSVIEGADKVLGNLNSPTAINQALLPNVNQGQDLGTTTFSWNTAYLRTARFFSGTVDEGWVAIDTVSPTGNSTNFGLTTKQSANALLLMTRNTSNSNDVLVETGNGSVGTSGDIVNQTGTAVTNSGDIINETGAAGGTRGSIKNVDGSEGTIGHVWTSKGVDGSGEWAEATGGSGEGGINYITNSDAEVDLSDWNTYYDGAVSEPIDGSGGVSGQVIASGGSAIRGTNCFSVTKTGSDFQGAGFSTDLAIDQADKFKTLYGYIDYLITDADTEYVSGDYRIFVYDIDNATLLGALNTDLDGDIPPAFEHLQEANTIMGTFQATDSLNYRFIIHATTTTTGTWNFKWDRVRVTSDSPVPGAIVTEWQEFTPTWNNVTLGNGTVDAYWRRVGDNMEIQASLVMGSTTSVIGSLTVVLPNSKVIDLTKMASNVGSAPERPCGIATALDSGSAFRTGNTFPANNTAIGMISHNGGGTWGITNPHTWATGDELGVTASIPIVDWSAGAILSTTETLFSTVKASAFALPTGTLSNVWNKVTFGSTVNDTHSAYNTSTGVFTAPKTGFYSVSAFLEIRTTSHSSGLSITSAVRVVNTVTGESAPGGTARYQTSGVTITLDQRPQCSGIIHASKGDTIEVQSFFNAPSGMSFINTLTNSGFSINEDPDFSTFSVHGTSEVLAVESSIKTAVGSAIWHQLTGNSLTLGQGKYRISGDMEFKSSGGSPDYTRIIAAWFSTNGTDTAAVPTALTLDTFGIDTDIFLASGALFHEFAVPAPSAIITVTSSQTVYLNAYSVQTLSGRCRIRANIFAERIS